MDIYFITGNANKFEEARSIIPRLLQCDIDLPEIQEVDPQEVIAAKLVEAQKHREGVFIVEDTSLYLDAVGGLPGPLIKWFTQSLGNEGIYDLVHRYKNYQATAKTVIGYSGEDGHIQFFEGVIKGVIVAPSGDSTFGWDPIFQPEGHEKTFAEMSDGEKNKISMRKNAFEKLQIFLDVRK